MSVLIKKYTGELLLMPGNSICSRMLRKLARNAFRFEPVYRFAILIASHINFRIPQSRESRRMLKNVSFPPTTCTEIEPRQWPLTPEVDITVVVPCYNVENYVVDCIESLVSQVSTYSFEIIAVDDGSTDSTGFILDELSNRYSNLRVIHQVNRGLSGARNVGISRARGATIAFVDSDDILKPGALELLATERERLDVDFVTASYEVMSQDGSSLNPINGRRTHGAPWGRLYTREIWANLDFPEGYWFEDTVQSFLIDNRFTEAYVDESVYLYRTNSAGICSQSLCSKRSLDTYWIVEHLLDRADELGLQYNQHFHDRTVYQLGPILFNRCVSLTGFEMRALFSVCCELHSRRSGDFRCSLGGRWSDLERSFRERSYSLWVVAVLGLG